MFMRRVRPRGSPRPPFADRQEAGEALAARVLALPLGDEPQPPMVLALPRGGVPVATVVAQALRAPLDLLLVRKIGAPDQPELAVAAVVDGTPPHVVAQRALCEALGVDAAYLADASHAATAENARRRRVYLGGRPAPAVAGRCVIVVDDGVATGTTMLAALEALRAMQPSRLVVAVPVSSREAAQRLRPLVDDWVCLAQPTPFEAVGRHYRHFEQVSDEEVLRGLAAAADALAGTAAESGGGEASHEDGARPSSPDAGTPAEATTI